MTHEERANLCWTELFPERPGITGKQRDIGIIAAHLVTVAAEATAAERERLSTPDMFWEYDGDGEMAATDPADIADNLDVGSVFRVQCAKSLPDAFYVVAVDDRGRSDAIPATPEQIEEWKAREKARIEAQKQRWAEEKRQREAAAIRKEQP